MTVDEAIKQLQEISAQGKGNYRVTFDCGSVVVESAWVMEDEKCVDMFPYP